VVGDRLRPAGKVRRAEQRAAVARGWVECDAAGSGSADGRPQAGEGPDSGGARSRLVPDAKAGFQSSGLI